MIPPPDLKISSLSLMGYIFIAVSVHDSDLIPHQMLHVFISCQRSLNPIIQLPVGFQSGNAESTGY